MTSWTPNFRGEMLKMALDAQTMLGSMSQDLSHRRRQEIKPTLHKEFAGICSTSNEVSADWLFGDNVAEKLKNSRATANVIRNSVRPQISTIQKRYTPYNRPQTNYVKNLNFRNPSQQTRGGFKSRTFPFKRPMNNYQQMNHK